MWNIGEAKQILSQNIGEIYESMHQSYHSDEEWSKFHRVAEQAQRSLNLVEKGYRKNLKDQQ